MSTWGPGNIKVYLAAGTDFEKIAEVRFEISGDLLRRVADEAVRGLPDPAVLALLSIEAGNPGQVPGILNIEKDKMREAVLRCMKMAVEPGLHSFCEDVAKKLVGD